MTVALTQGQAQSSAEVFTASSNNGIRHPARCKAIFDFLNKLKYPTVREVCGEPNCHDPQKGWISGFASGN